MIITCRPSTIPQADLASIPARQRCANGEPADCILRKANITCSCGEGEGKTLLRVISLTAVNNDEIERRAAALPAIREGQSDYVIYLGDLASSVRGMPEGVQKRINLISEECMGLRKETAGMYGDPEGEDFSGSCRP